jgi:hypothetical protein
MPKLTLGSLKPAFSRCATVARTIWRALGSTVARFE